MASRKNIKCYVCDLYNVKMYLNINLYVYVEE